MGLETESKKSPKIFISKECVYNLKLELDKNLSLIIKNAEKYLNLAQANEIYFYPGTKKKEIMDIARARFRGTDFLRERFNRSENFQRYTCDSNGRLEICMILKMFLIILRWRYITTPFPTQLILA